MAGERIKELCDKLYHPRNALCRTLIPKWYEDSAAWAKIRIEGEFSYSYNCERMRYILNHMCPNLVHLLPKPVYSYSPFDLDEDLSFCYEFENSQLRVITCSGRVISHGIEHTEEEWEYLVCAIYPLVGLATNVDFETYLVSVGLSSPPSERCSAIRELYECMLVSLTSSEN